MKDGKYFKFSEFVKSDTADRHNIDNYPKSAEIISNLFDVIIILDKIRTFWKEQIIVTSGYRCDELNELIGGAENSGHKYGNAVDIITTNGRTAELFKFMKQFLKIFYKSFSSFKMSIKSIFSYIFIPLFFTEK